MAGTPHRLLPAPGKDLFTRYKHDAAALISFGIDDGLMNTTHAYTNSQVLLDQPEVDLRGARAAALSIVPYPSGAAKEIGKVIPELDGRLTGYSLRVPVPLVSVVDLTATLKREVTVSELNVAFREAAESGPLQWGFSNRLIDLALLMEKRGL